MVRLITRRFDAAMGSPSGDVRCGDHTNGDTASPEDSRHFDTSIIGPESS